MVLHPDGLAFGSMITGFTSCGAAYSSSPAGADLASVAAGLATLATSAGISRISSNLVDLISFSSEEAASAAFSAGATVYGAPSAGAASSLLSVV